MKNTTPSNPSKAIHSHTQPGGWIALSLALSFTAGRPEVQEKIRAMKKKPASRGSVVYAPTVQRFIKEVGIKPTAFTEKMAKQKKDVHITEDEYYRIGKAFDKIAGSGEIHRLVAGRIIESVCNTPDAKTIADYIKKPPKCLTHVFVKGSKDFFYTKDVLAFIKKRYVLPDEKPVVSVPTPKAIRENKWTKYIPVFWVSEGNGQPVCTMVPLDQLLIK